MTERLEPTFSGKVALDDPEHSASPRAHAASRAEAKAGTTRPKPRPAAVSQRVVEVKSPLAPLALVASVIALGLGGLLFWQVSTMDQERKSMLATLASAESRIAELEQKLTLTGDESEQSLATLGAGVKTLRADVEENSSEVRKLWGVAYDRNRKAIDDNKKVASSAQAAVKSLKTAQQKELTAVQAKLDELRGELAVLSEVQESQQAAFNQTRNVGAEVQALKTDLTSRITANEEAINAIDAFRLQVNRRLLELGGPAQ